MKKYCLNCMREVTSGTFCADCVNLNIQGDGAPSTEAGDYPEREISGRDGHRRGRIRNYLHRKGSCA